jgi:hypothetical protein
MHTMKYKTFVTDGVVAYFVFQVAGATLYVTSSYCGRIARVQPAFDTLAVAPCHTFPEPDLDHDSLLNTVSSIVASS